MAQIVPSILEDTQEGFADRSAEILKIPEVQRIQVDISDGKFTPRKTLELSQIDLLSPAYFWEAHLMVENPGDYLLDAKIAGFNSAIFHFEAIPDKTNLKTMLLELQKLKLQSGLAIDLDTAVEDILEYARFFDQVLILDVRPGYSGQKLAGDTVAKVEKLKKQLKNVKIEVDGGVKFDNIKALVRAGAELLVVNSALFDPGPDNLTPTQNFEKLLLEAQNL